MDLTPYEITMEEVREFASAVVSVFPGNDLADRAEEAA